MNPNLAAELGQELLKRQLFVAAAESLTCGNIQAIIGSVSGSSNYFAGGVTAYRIEDKARLLKVDEPHARSVNAVSERVAVEMARGVCELFDCDIGIGTTGYAEPAPAQGVAQPFAHYAVWSRGKLKKEGVIAAAVVEGGGASRNAMQRLVAEHALAGLLDYLRG
jgi:nicotinamide-nucleotide amidase